MKSLKLIYEELLVEGSSDILYHFTWEHRLENILHKNSMYLTTGVGTSSDNIHNKNKGYFASFSRTKSTKHGYGGKFNREGAVRIKFDGKKLASKYKIFPIDYWQYPRTSNLMGGSGDEMEDRLVSNRNEIPEIDKYIISIDVFLPKEGINEELIKNAEILGIKLYFYDNSKYFAFGNPKYSVKPIVNNSQSNASNSDDFRVGSVGYILGAICYRSSENKRILVDKLNNFNESELISIIDGYVEKYNNYLIPYDTTYKLDLINSLSADIHNNKTKSDKFSRLIIKLFNKDYTKMGAKSIKDYLNKKMYIGRKTHSDFNKEFYQNLVSNFHKYLNENINKYLSFGVYDKNGDYIEPVSNYKPIVEFVKDKANKLLKYYKNFILNNNDMYKHLYEMDYTTEYSSIRKEIDIDEGAEAAIQNLQDVSTDEILRPIMYTLHDIYDFLYSERNRIKEENDKQWQND